MNFCLDMHEIAVVSGFGAAYRLGASYVNLISDCALSGIQMHTPGTHSVTTRIVSVYSLFVSGSII
jgi:hypothetical protein